jgi:hypothetical protein
MGREVGGSIPPCPILRSVAQFGQSASFGARKPQVRILLLRVVGAVAQFGSASALHAEG